MKILRYYVFNNDSKIKYFDTEEELLSNYKNYIAETGYSALGVEYIAEGSELPGSVDLVARKEGLFGEEWDRTRGIFETVGNEEEAEKLLELTEEIRHGIGYDGELRPQKEGVVIKHNGYRFTKEEIMFVKSLDTEEEYQEYLNYYNSLDYMGKTSVTSNMDRMLEKYLDYADDLENFWD